MIPYATPFPICTPPQVMETYSSREPTDCFCSSYTCRSLSVPSGTSGGYPVIPYSVSLSYWSWSGNILQSWTHGLFPFPKYLSWFVGPVFVLLSFRFCRSFTPLLTLPLRRTLTYPPFYRWIFCVPTVRFFRSHLRNAPGCGFSWSCPRTRVGSEKTRYFPAIEGLPWLPPSAGSVPSKPGGGRTHRGTGSAGGPS